MDMAHTFALHGAETPAGFDLHMVQLCKPEKAAKVSPPILNGPC